jgi:hypothetical protein
MMASRIARIPSPQPDPIFWSGDGSVWFGMKKRESVACRRADLCPATDGLAEPRLGLVG